VNLRTGLTPGKLFQISMKREAGHFRAALSSSLGFRKRSLSGLLSAFLAEAKAVMLLPLSIAKIVISWESPFSQGFRVHDIHHSGTRHNQANSAAFVRGDGRAPHPLLISVFGEEENAKLGPGGA
jgi:hypothetical protein